MRHPSEAQLALFAGGDLARWDRWCVARHLRKCPQCRNEVLGFRAVDAPLKELASDAPKDLNWSRLAEEMTGNIRVGLAAGEAIAAFDRPSLRPRRLGWHAAFVLGGATAIFLLALWMTLPQPQASHLLTSLGRIRTERIGRFVSHSTPGPEEVVLEASPSSIEVKDHDRALSLMHPGSEGVTVSVSLQGSAGVRYVDADTGQVTTNKVYYAEQ